MIRIVIDSNVLLVSISRSSKFNWIFQKMIEGKVEIAFSNEILFEYLEIITEFFNHSVAKNTIRLLISLPNAHFIHIFYNWNLINSDPSDNKFVDAAISSNTDYILTNDKDFNVFKKY